MRAPSKERCMMRTPDQTALFIAVMLRRSGERRARMSEKTLRLVAQRKKLRSAFVYSVMEVLQRDIGICMTELDSGGYGLIYVKSLEAAKAITAKKFLDGVHRQTLTPKQEDALWDEALPEESDEMDLDDDM